MIRVLQCVNNMHRAGLETMLMNYYRNIDRSEIQFDFLTHRPDRADYDDEIKSMGGKIYYAPRLYPHHYPEYFSYMKRFFAEHPEYKIVHSHIDAMSYLPLLAAKGAGIPVRIAHSHNTAVDFDFKYPLKRYFQMKLPSAATHYCACGQKAGEFLFRGRHFDVIPNAIDSGRFLFDPVARKRKREELHIEDQIVIGHVGRFSEQKNHGFLLEIFDRVLQLNPASVLLLIGTGEKEAEMQEKAKKMGLGDRIRFLGSRSDVNELYQAMDVFVMPSLYEGVPVVGIEAQFSGLPCVFSDKVPQEVCFTSNCKTVSLTVGSQRWAEQIMECGRNDSRAESIRYPHYDIRYAKTLLENKYKELYRQVL